MVNGQVITGGRDGKLHILDTKNSYAIACTIDVPFPLNKTEKAKPRAIDLDESGTKLVVGTAGSEIYKVEVKLAGGSL